MPFGLCNAPATFQRCMMEIFSDMIEDSLEMFMDDFSIYVNDFDHCASNLDKILKRCEDTHLVLNWEKCQFMATKRIGLGRCISSQGIQVDKAIVEIIEKLPIPTNMKVMCDASDFAVSAMLRQRQGKIFHAIYYASKTLTEAQLNYTTTEKEFLVIVFTFDKFHSYLISVKIKDHKGSENQVVGYLSRLEVGREDGNILQIVNAFPDEKLFAVDTTPWYADFVNYRVCGKLPLGVKGHRKERFLRDVMKYHWNELYLFKSTMEVELFIVRGMDFMGLFLSSFGNLYILVAIDYISKWVEAVAVPKDDAKTVIKGFHKHILTLFGTLKALIAYKTPLGMSMYQLVFGKACHFPLKLKHKAMWAIKQVNMDYDAARKKRLLDITELEEIRRNAYENATIYKENTK
ncbi:uncharacterized protein LOC108473957 [Gossypium arboreum]|uniref:uncharacterized protein LOC108473957 n=1 Tax=Gossypium arboreum TaxID=29729 RepID=UPI000818F4B5|nr:uncharacterized protein LOC108473957 [Gossypium arboreum]